jgi:hypothetical protein
MEIDPACLCVLEYILQAYTLGSITKAIGATKPHFIIVRITKVMDNLFVVRQLAKGM